MTHELVVTATGVDGSVTITMGLGREPDDHTGYVERKAREAYQDVFDTEADPVVEVEVKTRSTLAVVA